MEGTPHLSNEVNRVQLVLVSTLIQNRIFIFYRSTDNFQQLNLLNFNFSLDWLVNGLSVGL